MAHHEEKHCPRCGKQFECKVGSILQCQCHGFNFTEQEKDRIRNSYSDCLCHDCLTLIKHEFHTLDTQNRLEKILSSIKKK